MAFGADLSKVSALDVGKTLIAFMQNRFHEAGQGKTRNLDDVLHVTMFLERWKEAIIAGENASVLQMLEKHFNQR